MISSKCVHPESAFSDDEDRKAQKSIPLTEVSPCPPPPSSDEDKKAQMSFPLTEVSRRTANSLATNSLALPTERKRPRKNQYSMGDMAKVGMRLIEANINRRRMCHMGCSVVLAFVPVALLLILSAALSIETVENWDSSLGPLYVDLKGCDLFLSQSTENTIGTVRIKQFVSGKTEYRRHTNSQMVQYAVAENPDGCYDVWRQECHNVCSIYVATPTDGSIEIVQSAKDKTPKIRVQTQGAITMASLSVGKWSNPSTDFIASQLTADSLSVKVAGKVQLTESTVPSLSVESMKNSVYILRLNLQDQGVSVQYRQSEFRASTRFWGAELPSYDERPPFEDSACNITQQPMYGDWSAQFEEGPSTTTGGFGVSATDFETFYNSATCCGGSCPMFSACRTYKWSLYGASTNNFLSFSDLASEIVRLELTQLAPWLVRARCRQHINMQPSGATVRTMQVAAAGDLMFESYHNSTVVDTSQYWQNSNMLDDPKIRLLQEDADILQKEVGKEYGHRDSEQDIFVVIDLIASPGVPGGRYIYTTKEVYLSLPPHLISFVAGSMLLPEIKLYTVHCTNPWANNGQSDYLGHNWANATAKDVARAEIFEQLHLALRPLWQQQFLRGRLVLLTEHGMLGSNLKTWTKDIVTGDWEQEDYANQTGLLIHVALIISLCIAALGSALVSFHAFKFGKFLLKRLVKNEQLKIRMSKLGEEMDPGDCSETGQQPSGASAAERLHTIAKADFNPFLVPQTLITMFFTRGVRAKFTDSLSRFVSTCCLLEKDKIELATGQILPDLPTVTHQAENGVVKVAMYQFSKIYSSYCYHNSYHVKEDRIKVQRELIADYGVKIKPFNLKRLVGIKWKDNISGLINGYDSDSKFKYLQQVTTTTEVLAAFFENCCDVSATKFEKIGKLTAENKRNYIVYRPAAHGLVLGHIRDDLTMQDSYTLWCAKHDIPEEFCQLPLYTDVAREFSLGYMLRQIKRIDGLYVKVQFGENASMPIGWYGWMAVDTMVHFICLFTVPMIIAIRAVQMQYMYSLTMAPLFSQEPLMWYHVLEGGPDGVNNMLGWWGKYVLPTVKVIVIQTLAYLVLATLRMFIHFAEIANPTIIKFVEVPVKYIFAAVLVFQTWLSAMYIVLVLTWALLAAVLSPQDYLVYGVAVAVGGAVIAATHQHLTTAAESFSKLMSQSINDEMNKAVAAAATAQAEKRGEIVDAEQVAATDDEEHEFDARDLFHLLNDDEDATLDLNEFKALFELLDIAISDDKQDLLFALCDDDCSGCINEEEFAASWEYFHDVFVEEAVAQAGLGEVEIITTILIIVILLLSVFAFLFMAIAAWSNQSNFLSVIRSLIVTALGGLINVIRPGQGIADDKEEQRKQIKERMKSLQEEDNDE